MVSRWVYLSREEFETTTNNTKSQLIDKENSHVALIQPVQGDVHP